MAHWRRQQLAPTAGDFEVGGNALATVGLEDLEQLRERIGDVLTQQKRNDRRTTWRRFILDHLEQGIDQGELPPSLVQATLREQLDRYAYTMAMQGVDVDPEKINWQEIAAKAEPAARQEVLDTLILEQLADEGCLAGPAGRCALTAKGMRYHDSIAARFAAHL